MSKFKNKYRIESARLKDWDYSKPGAYFVTIVTNNRENLFGKIIDGKMILNNAGEISYRCWMDIPIHFPHVELDEFIIMPNHIHGIIFINDKIRGKIGVTKWYREGEIDKTIWQSRFHDHIIRNEIELQNIRQYIKNNPINWCNDDYNL